MICVILSIGIGVAVALYNEKKKNDNYGVFVFGTGAEEVVGILKQKNGGENEK